MKEKLAENIVQTSLSGIVAHKGGIIVILGDNDTLFTNTVLTAACQNIGIKRLYSKPFHPKGNLRIENVYNFLKRRHTKFLDSSNLEWDELIPTACYCYNIFPSSNETEPLFYLMYSCEPAEDWLTYSNNWNRYYRDNSGKIILITLHKLWKHHIAYLKDIHYRKDDSKLCKPRNKTKFEIGQTVIVKNSMHHMFKPNYQMDYRVMKVLNESTVLQVLPSKPVISFYTSRTGAYWCSILFGSVKSLSLQDSCLCPCCVLPLFKCVQIIPLQQIWNQYTDSQ